MKKITFLIIFLSSNTSMSMNFDGYYKLSDCDSGRFSIVIKKINERSYFNIFDKKIIIKKGWVKFEKNLIRESRVIKLGNIEGELHNKNIVIQNYGNSMNEYIHFTQCDNKYLNFIKQEN
ncbi:hypothetical protein [Conservatibacter flavescens]|uniref:Uncharacterized protein n=1 Tax=Conservatibacter flavescens TaxID=28161 RepID=A0A2M8RZH2_9PAST|nr:hypothetical protein [Conservatibacter flavescens]PJG84293.1 hypothetical protein CVP05_12115 [Conservatibacter flavescens]